MIEGILFFILKTVYCLHMKTTTKAGTIYRNADAVDTGATRTPPRAPARALQVLSALAQAEGALSLASLSVTLALPKTSAMHLLRALEASGYVRRTPTGFELGSSSYHLAAQIGTSVDFDKAAQGILQDVLDATRETVLLGTYADDNLSTVYTMRLPSPQAVRFAPEVGGQRPIYASGIGKLLLAYASTAFVEDYLSKVKMVPYTGKTVVTRTKLMQRLRQIRKDGFATSVDELADGGSSVVAPIFDNHGKVDLALVIAAPTHRFLSHQAELAHAATQGAARLSALRGYMTA